eukprot:COSAG02_NODE_3710_length_6342_cov_30.226494_4_plen_218_part_00
MITENVHGIVAKSTAPDAEDTGLGVEAQLHVEKVIVPDSRAAKYASVNTIRMGHAEEAAQGLNHLLGIDDDMFASIVQEREHAIEREFMENGTPEDKANFHQVCHGSVDEDDNDVAKYVEHPNARAAGLKLHHVIALRMYTTSSFASINDPFRTDPPAKPHPFAATAYFISDAVKKLRVLEAQSTNTESKVFWRGLKDTDLTEEFTSKGGTELACMS